MSDTNKEYMSGKLSDLFEEELDDYFEEKAHTKAVCVTDRSKKIVKNERHDDPGDDTSKMMSGCCQTGCFDCPWGYRFSQN